MAWCASHLQEPAAEEHSIAVTQWQGDVVGAGGGQTDGAACGLMHQPAAGHMVGMSVGIEAGHQIQFQLVQ